MRKNLYIFILLLFSGYSFSQNINLMFQVNDKLLNYGELANLYITFSNDNLAKRFYVNYFPGDLILNEEIWSEINSPSTDKFYVHFDYYTYNKGNQQVKGFDIQIEEKFILHPYLIVNIYDFRDKKYKRWYQWHTQESYLVEFKYPESGILIRAN